MAYDLAKDGPKMYADGLAMRELGASGGLAQLEPVPLRSISSRGVVQLASVGGVEALGPLAMVRDDSTSVPDKGTELGNVPISFIGETLLLANRVVQKQFMNAGKKIGRAHV